MRGDRALEGGRAAAVIVVVLSPPVIFLRSGGRELVPFVDGAVLEIVENSAMGASSAPRAGLRAFSCLFCTVLKCCKSSAHLMSSRPSLERVLAMLLTELGLMNNKKIE